MTDGGSVEPPDDQHNRNLKNAVTVIVVIVLVATGTWLFRAMIDMRKAQDCAAQGRRNCAEIELPDRAR